MISSSDVNTPNYLSGDYKVECITGEQSSDPFFANLNRPQWFKDHMRPQFDSNRRECEGVIVLLHHNTGAESKVIGCIYVEVKSKHLTYGEHKPIFGWIQAESEGVFQ